MKQIPKKIRVGPMDLAISSVQPDHPTLEENLNGAYLPDEGLIYIQKAQAEMCKRETLFHEILHVCLDMTGERNRDDEEQIVSALSPILLDTLMRNKGLTQYLMGE